LQQLLWVVYPIRKLSFRAERLGGQSGHNLVAGVGGIFTDKSDLVDLDARIALERGAQLVDQRFGAARRAARRKRAHKSSQAGLRAGGRKMDARDSGVGKQTRETALRRGRFQRHAVDMKRSSGSSEQEAGVAGNFQRRAKLFPGGFKLGGRAGMTEFVQPGKFQQNV
jgi:hypothetical protein